MTRAQVCIGRSGWYPGLVSIRIACALLMLSQFVDAQAPTRGIQAEIQKLVPKHATITQRMAVDFGNGVEPGAVAVVYTLPPVYADSENVGLSILRRRDVSSWTIAYQETDRIDPGGDEWTLQKVRAASGQEAVVAVYYHSGAGTTTNWKLIAAVRGKLVPFDPTPIRDKVLKARHSVFLGYNGVKSDRDIVIETIPSYSPDRARCCADKPTVAIRIRFTGTRLKLDSVGQLADQNAR